MAAFLSKPELKWVGGDYPWELTENLEYVSERHGYFCIPAGYRTDFASVPRLPFAYWAAGGKAVLPSILHDHCYDCRTAVMTRKQADKVFLEAMKAASDPASGFTRWVMYAAVRAGGGRGWQRDSSHKCINCR